MKNRLFKKVDCQGDPHWLVEEFFNSIYQQDRFMRALPLIVGKSGYGVNEEYCFFPDLADPDPVYHFSGVTFGTFEHEVVVTDEQCAAYLEEACALYLEVHPEYEGTIRSILASGA